MSSIKGIIFDYGGTIDTNGIHWGEVIYSAYINSGIDIDRDIYRQAYVHGERTLAKNHIIESSDTFHLLLEKKIGIQVSYLKEEFGITGINACKEKEIVGLCYSQVIETISTARKIVEGLAKEYPMVLVTNFYGNMPVVLNELGLDRIFTEIVESSVVGIRKPDPALFVLGVEALGFRAEEIVVIGDSYSKDIYPASSLGCRTVWLKKICWSEESIISGHEPTAIIESIEEVPQTIKAFS